MSEFPPAPQQSSAEQPCSMCRMPYPAQQMFNIQNQWFICPACLPQYQALYPQYFAPQPYHTGYGQDWRTFRREGKKTLVFNKALSLPHRCVKCNSTDAPHRKTAKLSWASPFLAFLILAGVLVYAIVYIVVCKKATVEYSLCPVHSRKRIIQILASTFLILGSFGFLFLAAYFENGWFVVAFFVALIYGIIHGVLFATALRPKKIDDQTVWLNGCCEGFVDSCVNESAAHQQH